MPTAEYRMHIGGAWVESESGGRSEATSAEAVRAGWVNLNEPSNYWESHLRFGGRVGPMSGVGRVGSRFPLETFTEPKTVVVSLD